MEMQPLRIRLTFDDCSVLSQAQRSDGMNQSWILIEPNQHPKISDVCAHLLHNFNLRSSCPNGILLSMEGFVLPSSESTRILKDKDIICVKRKVMALAEAIEGADACNLLNDEVNRREPVDNGMLLLANEESDKETGGYQSEHEDAEVEKSEDGPSPKEKSSKKRKASTKLQTSKKKKHRLVVTDGVEDKVPAEDNGIHDDTCLLKKIINKKIKSNKEKMSGLSETIIVKVKSPSKVKRKKKHRLGVTIGDEDDVNNGESILNEKISKKKTKLNEEIKKANAKPSDKNIEDDVEGVELTSSAPVGVKKVPSRSARRKKAKRKWRLELAKSAQNPNTHVEPEISKTDNKEATGHSKGPPNIHVEPEISKTENKESTVHSEGPLKLDQVPAKVMHNNITEQEGKSHHDNGVTKLVPCVVRRGHIRFEPLDEDEEPKQIEVPDVAFQWNGIISKKKGQKWGLEKFSTSRRDDFQKPTEEPSAMLTVDAQVPLIDHIAFDQLPLCGSPKEGDVIAYRVVELSSSWTPELSSFRVGKISYYDADNVILMPVPEYPIVLDRMDENGPDNSLYKEDGSLEHDPNDTKTVFYDPNYLSPEPPDPPILPPLVFPIDNIGFRQECEIKFAALADVRSLKQSNSDVVKAVSNGADSTAQVDEKNATSSLMSSSNANKENLSKDPSPSPAQAAIGNKEGNTWSELEEFLSAKKSELLETNEEMKRDSGWNKWSYRALRGSALGPTISLLRSKNDI